MPRQDPNILRRFLTPPSFEDAAKTDTAWVLHWLFWTVAGLVTLLILLLIPTLGGDPKRFLLQAGFVDVLCLGMILLLRRGRVETAAATLVVGMWAIAIFTVWTSDGLLSPAISTFLLAIAYTALFFGAKWAVTSVVAAAALFFSFAFMHTNGLVPEPTIAHTPWSRALTLTTYSVILAGALMLIARTLERARKRTERELSERRAAESEVRSLNTDLEARVAQRTAALETAIAELEISNARLEAATRAKSDFLAAMSHELRTPLNSVIGFSGILSSGMAGDLNSEQKRQVEMIGESGRLLLDLVNKVLDLTKIEAGSDTISLTRFDLGDAISRVVELARPLAAEKGLELICTVTKEVSVVRSDRLRIEQALLNLVGNAVKFTETGTIAVTATATVDEVSIEVTDTGKGIASKDLDLIFDQFYQARPQRGAKHEGAGLGLPLARQLMESIGGSVEAESTLGNGSTFRIRLPLTN